MTNLFNYRIEVDGGKFNGLERYYDTYWKAEQQAKRYAKIGRTGIIGDHVYVEIYQICRTDYSKELIDTIENV